MHGAQVWGVGFARFLPRLTPRPTPSQCHLLSLLAAPLCFLFQGPLNHTSQSRVSTPKTGP